MTQEHRVSEKEQAIPFLVIPDVLFTFLVVTTELLFSEHSRAHDASDDLWHAQSLPVVMFVVCGEFCVCVPLSTVTLSNSVSFAWLFAASAALTKPGNLTSLTKFVYPLADHLKKNY